MYDEGMPWWIQAIAAVVIAVITGLSGFFIGRSSQKEAQPKKKPF